MFVTCLSARFKRTTWLQSIVSLNIASFIERAPENPIMACVVAGRSGFAAIPLIAGIHPSNFGAKVSDASHLRADVLDAIDFLLGGY
jgi:hypothetical protein